MLGINKMERHYLTSISLNTIDNSVMGELFGMVGKKSNISMITNEMGWKVLQVECTGKEWKKIKDTNRFYILE